MPDVVFEASPVWTRILKDNTGSVAALLKEHLREKKQGSEYSNRGRYGGWDGYVNFYSARFGFPTGLHAIVRKLLHDRGLSSSFVPSPLHPFPKLLTAEASGESSDSRVLRPHQLQGVATLFNRKRCAIEVGTGGGKTLIGGEIIRRSGLPTLWMCQRTQLAAQTAEELSSWLGCRVGMIYGGKVDATGTEPVVVGLVQSLTNLPADNPFWKWVKLLVIDECQYASSLTWYDISMRATEAWYRLGLSGTLRTGDAFRDLKLQAATGPFIQIAGVEELIANGYNAAPQITIERVAAASYAHVDEAHDAACPAWRSNKRLLRSAGGKIYGWVYRQGIIKNWHRNRRIRSITQHHLAQKERVLILVAKTEHGAEIEKQLLAGMNGSAAKLYYLHSGVAVEQREKWLKEFRAAKHGACLLASPLFDVGMDVPEIDVEIDAGGGSSLMGLNQRLGRAVRTRDDKTTVKVYNFLDGFSDPSKPHRKDYLMKHSLARIAEYQKHGFVVKFAGNSALKGSESAEKPVTSRKGPKNALEAI